MTSKGRAQNKKKNLFLKEPISDGKTSVVPLAGEQQKYNTQKSIKLKNPLLIAGFPGPGLVGSICASYIIEELNLHQIAYVESEFIMPGVIYVGGSLRHPFRLYADKSGNLCVLICEIPILSHGICSIFNTVVNWAKKFGVKETIVLEGIPIDGIPTYERKALVLSNNWKTSNFDINSGTTIPSSSYNLDSNGIDSNNRIIPQNEENMSKKKSTSSSYLKPAQDHTAIIAGVSGGLLAACLSNGIACKGLLVPATANIPDPEAAAILIETINQLRDNPLNLDTSKLRERGVLIKQQLEKMLKSIMDQQSSKTVMNQGTMYS